MFFLQFDLGKRYKKVNSNEDIHWHGKQITTTECFHFHNAQISKREIQKIYNDATPINPYKK